MRFATYNFCNKSAEAIGKLKHENIKFNVARVSVNKTLSFLADQTAF